MIRNNSTDDFCVDVNGVAKTICLSCYKMTTFDNYVYSPPLSCAIRGRNPDHPSDRTAGMDTEQRLELGGDVANCITTIKKDSMVAEPVLVGGVGERNLGKQLRQGNRIYDANGIAIYLMAQPVGNAGGYSYLYKVEDSRSQIANISEGIEPEMVEPFIKQYPRGFNHGFEYKDGISPSITSSSWENNNLLFEPKCIGYTRDKKGNVVKRHLTDYCNTFHTSTGGGGNTDCFIYEPQIIQIGNIYSQNKNPQAGRVYSKKGISPTLDTMLGGNRQIKIMQDYRIRKLTPRECFRLMGVSEENIDKIQNAGISKTQQYKMAGNSIVVDVLYHIFRKLFIDKKQETSQLTLF